MEESEQEQELEQEQEQIRGSSRRKRRIDEQTTFMQVRRTEVKSTGLLANKPTSVLVGLFLWCDKYVEVFIYFVGWLTFVIQISETVIVLVLN